MKVFGNVAILDDEREDEDPYFADKVVIVFSYVPNPDRVWPGNIEMRDYCADKSRILLKLGLLNQEALHAVQESNGSEEFATSVHDLALAQAIFERMATAGVIDIYLYQNGELIEKYD